MMSSKIYLYFSLGVGLQKSLVFAGKAGGTGTRSAGAGEGQQGAGGRNLSSWSLTDVRKRPIFFGMAVVFSLTYELAGTVV